LFPFFRNEGETSQAFGGGGIFGGSLGLSLLVADRGYDVVGSASQPVCFPRFHTSSAASRGPPPTVLATSSPKESVSKPSSAAASRKRSASSALVTEQQPQSAEVGAILEPRASSLGAVISQFYSGPRFISEPARLHVRGGRAAPPGVGGIFALARDRWRELIGVLVEDVTRESSGAINGTCLLLRAPGVADAEATVLLAVPGGTASRNCTPVIDLLSLPSHKVAMLSRSGRLVTGAVLDMRLPVNAFAGMAWPTNATLNEAPPTASVPRKKSAAKASSGRTEETPLPVSNVVIRAPLVCALSARDLLWELRSPEGSGDVTFLYDICHIAAPIPQGIVSSHGSKAQDAAAAAGARHMMPNREDFLASMSLDLIAWAGTLGGQGRGTKAREAAEAALKAVEGYGR
jgi:hypothetical protein